MRIRRGHHEQNFTILPNAFLQDERLSWATRGLLGEVLSRPDGWAGSADSLSDQARKARPDLGRGEGRRAVRAMFAEGKRYGYIIVEKERIGPGEDGAGRFRTVLAFYDTPQHPDQGTASGMSVPPAETGKSPVRTDVPLTDVSVSGTSIERTENKDSRSTKNGATAQAPDKSAPPSNPPAIAEAPAGAGASANGKSAGKAEKEAHRGDTRQRDDSWRLQLQAANLDDLYDALATYRDARGGLEEWAYHTAASDLGIDFGAKEAIPEQADGDWTRATYLYLLKKHDSDPGDREIQSGLLEPLDSSIEAPERPYRVVQKLPPPVGVSPRKFADQMKATVTKMEPTEIGPYIAEFRDVRRGVWWESLNEAEKRLRARKEKVTAQAKNYVALHVAIDRYVGRGTWEMELVPPSMRSQGWQSPGEAPPWAA